MMAPSLWVPSCRKIFEVFRPLLKLSLINKTFGLILPSEQRHPILRSKRAVNAAQDVLYKYYDLFSTDNNYGTTDLLEHSILIEAGTRPIKDKPRPIAPGLVKSLREQIDKWLDQDVIEPSTSPWSANLVAVKKKDGTVRWCIDYRRLNKVMVKDAYPMPTVKDCLGKLAGSTIFSAVDMQDAFHCVRIASEDKRVKYSKLLLANTKYKQRQQPTTQS